MSAHLETPVPAAPIGWRVLAPLKFREYRLLIAAVAISIFASGMWTVVMALQVIAIDDDPASLSLVAACFGGGMLAFILVGGVAADRFPQRSIIIAVESVNFGVVAAAAILGGGGALQLWHMAVAAAVLGIGAGFFYPAYSAYLPRILPAEQLLAANGIEGVIRPTLQRAAGPAVAGVLVGATAPAAGLTTVAALYGVGLALLIATRPIARAPEPARETSAPRQAVLHALADLRNAFIFMLRTPWLLWTLLFASLFVLVLIGPIEVLMPFITQARFDDGEQIYGFVMGAFGIGGAVGSLAVSSGRMPRRYLTVMMLSWGLGSLPLALVGNTSSVVVMAAAVFAIGVADGTAMVIWGTLLQRRVPPEMLGRVSSLDFFVSLAFMPVSMAVAGPLSKVVSVETIFWAAGVVPMVLAVIAIVAARMPQDEIAHPLR